MPCNSTFFLVNMMSSDDAISGDVTHCAILDLRHSVLLAYWQIFRRTIVFWRDGRLAQKENASEPEKHSCPEGHWERGNEGGRHMKWTLGMDPSDTVECKSVLMLALIDSDCACLCSGKRGWQIVQSEFVVKKTDVCQLLKTVWNLLHFGGKPKEN